VGGCGSGLGDLGGLQYLGSAEFGDLDGSHSGGVSLRGRFRRSSTSAALRTDRMVCAESSRVRAPAAASMEVSRVSGGPGSGGPEGAAGMEGRRPIPRKVAWSSGNRATDVPAAVMQRRRKQVPRSRNPDKSGTLPFVYS